MMKISKLFWNRTVLIKYQIINVALNFLFSKSSWMMKDFMKWTTPNFKPPKGAFIIYWLQWIMLKFWLC